jgi:eukaryotic-like serine/threonine-protein kinase
MELVEGETLEERIARGPIPAEEALKIAHQIAEALEAAHEKSIIHRDLKPANVKITPEDKVKVLDFGLAKALETAPTPVSANSPTMLSGVATNAGIILGTAGYMSPEQARGHSADVRSDVFSFGCVLYEMLSGRRSFTGETLTDMIASVVAREPDYRALPPNLNPRTEELLRRCLAKNRKDRWHAVADMRVELESILADPHGTKLRAAREVPQPPLWKRVMPFAITTLLVAAAAAALTVAWMNNRPSPPAVVARFPFVLPEDQRIGNEARNLIAVSRDGMNIVYIASQQLYLRSMGEMDGRPLQGPSENPIAPFFSPDGQWVGYVARAERKLKKIAITGGASVAICDVPEGGIGFGPTWAADNWIYVGQAKRIVRVSGNGGKLEDFITLKEGETAHRPQLLPGGNALLYTLKATQAAGSDRWDTSHIVVHPLKSGKPKVVIPAGSDARYVPTGHIVYALGSTLFAVRFDLNKLEPIGGPVSILEGVRRAGPGGGGGADANFSFSDNGSLVYVPGGEGTGDQLVPTLVDRSGSRKPLNIEARAYSTPRISPDGKRLALFTRDGKEFVVWTYDLAGTGPLQRFTFEGSNLLPEWSRDSQRIFFTSDREGDQGLFWQRADGGGLAERLVKAEPNTLLQPVGESPGGNVLIVDIRSNRPLGIGMLSLAAEKAEKKVTPIIPAPAGNSNLSHNGRWIAYDTSESGSRSDVFVEPFPVTGAKYQITTNGGTNPLWSPGDNQFFYIAPGRRLMSVEIQTQPSFVPGKHTALPIEGFAAGARPYDITPDGRFFVVLFPKSQENPEKPAPNRINVTLNWFEDLRQRVPEK